MLSWHFCQVRPPLGCCPWEVLGTAAWPSSPCSSSVSGTAVPESPRGPCARCDLISGAVLYTGRPKLHTVLQIGAAGASWREEAASPELTLSSSWGSEICNPQESKRSSLGTWLLSQVSAGMRVHEIFWMTFLYSNLLKS